MTRVPDTADRPAISVVVVARNEERKIGACMRSLAGQHYPAGRVEIILVDDGSTDATVDVARAASPGLRVVSNPGRSISANRNVGWRAARSGLVAFLDADCEAPQDWLDRQAGALAGLPPTAAAVGGGNRPPTGETPFYDALAVALDSWVGSRNSTQGRVLATARPVHHLPGLNVLIRRTALEAVGGYDERFARMGEDEDLSTRLRDRGFTLHFVPDAVVIHRQRDTLTAWVRNMFAYGRGRSWLLRRHPGRWSPVFAATLVLPLLQPLHALAVLAMALWLCVKAGRPALAGRVWTILLATHVAYGLGQWTGGLRRGTAPRPRRLALLGLKNAGNAGDAAIMTTVAHRLAEDGRLDDWDLYAAGIGPSGFDIRALPRDLAGAERVVGRIMAPAADARTVGTRPGIVADALRLALVMMRFDGVVIAGGHWLHDMKLGNHLVLTGALTLARLAGTARAVFCIGAGPLAGRLARLMVRLALGGGGVAWVRDADSQDLLRRCGLPAVIRAVDPVFALPQTAAPDPAPRAARPVVGISPCAWAQFANIYRRDTAAIDAATREWVIVCKALAARGVGVRIFPTMNPEDADYARHIAQALSDDGMPEIVDTAALTVQDLQGRIAACDAFVAMRLHPAIFCINGAVPFLALDYAPKVRGVLTDAGLADRIVPMAADWSAPVLARLAPMLDDPAPHRRQLRDAHRHLSHKALQAHLALARWLADPAAYRPPAEHRHDEALQPCEFSS
ncbi:MAG: glycosyltransferase [Rhodospirillaceae bacterium]|nr:glycosyltransferase [Rhodospirillaceae bacterium]